MHQPAKWWIGFIGVGALWLGADFFKTGAVEADLQGRAAEAIGLAAPDFASALSATASGRDVWVDGSEFVAGQGAKIISAADAAPGVRVAGGDLKPLAVASPYAFGAARAADHFTLSGNVPLPAVKADLLAAAKAAAPDVTIDDKLTYAAGAPDGFEAIAAKAISEAAKLQNGVANLSGKAYSISGDAATSSIFEAAIGATQRLPSGATLGKVDIRPPVAKPFSWAASSDGVTTTLSGFAPSIEARATIAAAAAGSLPGKVIVNNMAVASGAPAGDFLASTSYALAELGRLSKGRVSMVDGAYSITGEATTPQAWDAAIADTHSLPPGLSLAKADILPPELKPFEWSAALSGDTVTLSGATPSSDVRDAIARAAIEAFPGKNIINAMTIARGAPAGDFAAAAAVGLAQLATLSDGKATLSDAGLSIVGHGLPDVTNATVGAAAKAGLAAPFMVASVNIQQSASSPYVFKADVTDGKVTLTGSVPDDKARQDIVDAAKAAFFKDEVVDALTIAKGAPTGFVSALKAAFGPLSRLNSGSLSLSDGVATVDGLAVYEKAADQIKAALAEAMPAGFKLDQVSIGVKPQGPAIPPAECQPKFDNILAKGRILFETGSATVSKESAAVLDHLAGLIISCRDATIEVGGHTDSVGNPDKNLDLSKRRAQAVVDFINNAGIDVGRISSAGFGDTKPIASNDTAEGRAQNRRIEFLVK